MHGFRPSPASSAAVSCLVGCESIKARSYIYLHSSIRSSSQLKSYRYRARHFISTRKVRVGAAGPASAQLPPRSSDFSETKLMRWPSSPRDYTYPSLALVWVPAGIQLYMISYLALMINNLIWHDRESGTDGFLILPVRVRSSYNDRWSLLIVVCRSPFPVCVPLHCMPRQQSLSCDSSSWPRLEAVRVPGG
jgi:hypothetical protein